MIKIGNLNISSFKIGGADCSIYLGSVKLYPTEEPTPPAPMNVITYEATEKLAETTALRDNGLHTNAFSGTNGQQLTMTSHTFENGVGTIEFNGDIASIGQWAFNNCSGLISIEIPNSVTIISDRAFYYCSGLTSIEIPSGVISIGKSDLVFENCPWWSAYSADTSNHYGNIIYINNVAYQATSTTISSCEFKEGTVSIGDSAFNSCAGLTSVTIPNNVTSISNSAFRGCRGLTSIDIPSGVTNISNRAFYNCSSLTSVTVEPTTPPTLGIYVFDNTNNCLIYVPSESEAAYKAASGWSDYASRITVDNS